MKKQEAENGGMISEQMIDLLLNILETSKSKEDKQLAKKELRWIALRGVDRVKEAVVA